MCNCAPESGAHLLITLADGNCVMATVLRSTPDSILVLIDGTSGEVLILHPESLSPAA